MTDTARNIVMTFQFSTENARTVSEKADFVITHSLIRNTEKGDVDETKNTLDIEVELVDETSFEDIQMFIGEEAYFSFTINNEVIDTQLYDITTKSTTPP